MLFRSSSTNSKGGGLTGEVTGDEGMMSHRLPPGSPRRVGVRGVNDRSSVLEATRSRDGREHTVEYFGEFVLVDIEASDVVVMRARPASEEFRRATLRSVWRLFWNQIVTDLTSLYALIVRLRNGNWSWLL